MKAIFWKEFRENLKWAALPPLLILGPIGMFGALPLMEKETYFYVSLIAAVFGAALGFLQVFFESSGDKRSLLLHRPISRGRIFLGKAAGGVTLYLLALGVPFACVVALAATPGHVAEPFSWPMALPGLADVLTGLVYYFAGMLTAQREARWYGSRCLPLAAGLCCSYFVWVLPEFWQAALAILVLGGAVALAAWGSFLTGGAYAPQPRLARVALAATFLLGLSTLGFTAKVLLGSGEGNTEDWYFLDGRGRVLVVHTHNGRMQSVTDLEGRTPEELHGKWLDDHALKELRGPGGAAVDHSGPTTVSYRNLGRFLLEFDNDSKPGQEKWCYVPAQGRLVGYDRYSKQYVGSFGPEGFCPPDQEPRGRFEGKLLSGFSVFYLAWAEDYLVFADRVYAIDFRKRTVRPLFVAAPGETVLWASSRRVEKEDVELAGVVTDRGVYVLDEAGSRVFSAPWEYDRDLYHLKSVLLLDGPPRYRVLYEPRWYLDPATLAGLPGHVVEYDAKGAEVTRYTLPAQLQITGYFARPPLPLAEPSYRQVPLAAITSPAEETILVGARRRLFEDFRSSGGTEMWLLLQFLTLTTTFFIPGAGWNMPSDEGLAAAHIALVVLSAAVCALVCFLLGRRQFLSPGGCLGWAACGFLFGVPGVLLMLSLREWPARGPCPSCGWPRRVDRDRCEHCGASHALPPRDGTEIFEGETAAPEAALAGT